MKIKVLESVAQFNVRTGGVDSFSPGKEYDVDWDTHARFVSRGWANSLEPEFQEGYQEPYVNDMGYKVDKDGYLIMDEVAPETVDEMEKPKSKKKHTKKQGVAIENMGV